jgi:hypothetical protein
MRTFCNSRAKFSILVFVWFAFVSWLFACCMEENEIQKRYFGHGHTRILVLDQFLLLLGVVPL